MRSEKLAGTAMAYDRHVILCYMKHDAWPSRVESSEASTTNGLSPGCFSRLALPSFFSFFYQQITYVAHLLILSGRSILPQSQSCFYKDVSARNVPQLSYAIWIPPSILILCSGLSFADSHLSCSDSGLSILFPSCALGQQSGTTTEEYVAKLEEAVQALRSCKRSTCKATDNQCHEADAAFGQSQEIEQD
ncbi:sucrase/ferredoxin-like family protein [Artemisia annua]|uniref:Sucrase/ferredoxin-like family protein n=1 Tax=Artemisia annua TaxID=35608 RepID=A0A2U1NV95_ARTAN|nr:sucrase/ferredoxin-like family protein [Artemisia annua]